MAQRERRHSSFWLDVLVVVKIDVAVNHLSAWPGGWCPAPDLPSAVFRSCRQRCCCRRDRQVQYTLLGVDVGDAFYPFAVGLVRMELEISLMVVTYRFELRQSA